MTTRHSSLGEAGFTLVELSVSLFIFGLLAASGVALMHYAVGAQTDAKARIDQVGAIQRFSALLTADLGQASKRETRDELGNSLPVFIGGSGKEGELGMAFVRRGWSNPDGLPRASLQRVEYRVVKDRVERTSYPMLDGAQANPSSVIINHVRNVSFRYRQGSDWLDHWDAKQSKKLPSAVEVVMEGIGRGPLRQLFVTGTGEPPEDEDKK